MASHDDANEEIVPMKSNETVTGNNNADQAEDEDAIHLEMELEDHPKVENSCLMEPDIESSADGSNVVVSGSGPNGFLRYRNGLRKALPVRCVKKSKTVLPLDTVGLCNYMTFGWLSSIMWSIHKNGVNAIKSIRITRLESTEVNITRMEKFWQEELKASGGEKASFGKAVFRSFKTRIIIGAFASLLYAFFSLANPMLVIRFFLEYLSNQEVTFKSGIVYVIALAAIVVLKAFTDGFFWALNIEAAVRIKNGYLGLLYKRIVHLKTLQDKSVGDMVNFISNDGLRIWYGIIMGPYILGGPMILIMSCAYSIVYLGPWALLAWLVIIGFYPFALSLAKKSMDYRTESIKITDKRVTSTLELFTFIKVIKMYAWEKPFGKNILDLRKAESQVLKKSVLAQSVSMGSSMFVSLFASCLTFIGYVGSGNNLTPTEAFTFVSLMNIVQGSMMTIPFALKSLSEMFVTNARMKEILTMEPMTPYQSKTSDPGIVVEMKKASFSWTPNKYSKPEKDIEINGTTEDSRHKENTEKLRLKEHEDQPSGPVFTGPILKEITFTLKRSKMVGICGSFGCGKSSLLNACLGRMNLMSGTVAIRKRLAYVPQEAWIVNDTIRNNIVFGEDYDADRYKEILEACALTEDLKSFPAGDMTEVGERGTTLSGGQKQRISLARAAYSHFDVVLLDDPLSAVDVHVAQHIFKHCISGLMKNRSVLFATKQLEFLKDCDEIIVMSDGSILEAGSYEDLLSQNGELVSLLAVFEKEKEMKAKRQVEVVEELEKEEEEKVKVSGDEDIGDALENHTSRPKEVSKIHGDESGDESDLAKLIQEEEMEEGPLHFSTVYHYLKYAGGYLRTALVLLFFCLPVAGVTIANWFLYYWLKQGGGDSTFVTPDNVTVTSWRVVDHPDRTTYLIIYATFIPILIIFLVIRSISLTKVTLGASSNLHEKAFLRILHCPSSFFDSTPVGRIINRFSADLDEIDMRLPMNMEIFLTSVVQIVAAVAMIIYISPYFALASIPIGVVFFFLMSVFHSCIHELKNLDNITRSPVLSHLGTSVQGLTTIHAYNRMQPFIARFSQLLDANSVAVFLFFAANRWLAFWLDIISAAILLITGILILVTHNMMDPGLAGLALSFAIQMSGLFQFCTRLAVETEARFASVDRIQEYATVSEQESLDDETKGKVSSPWPSSGEIQLSNVNLRYKASLPLALRDVSLKIEPHQSVGIVGRTGAGKTSLTSILFRLVDVESGSVSIDGVNISTIQLHQLRSSLSIIPQDPVLFCGTLRYNLDPFEQYSDAELWQVLDKCHIHNMVESLELQLNTVVKESGVNFSVGERQLLCMARALLRKSQILILDEATAAIDAETTALIHSAIRESFSQCTTLIIAHRLASITDCDKVVVMENGQVKEFDSPSSLLSKPESKFKSMMDASQS